MSQPFHGGRARRLPPELAMLRVTNAKHRLPAVFGTGLLIFLALGVMIGGGIFSLAGEQAATMAGSGRHRVVRHRGGGVRAGGAVVRRAVVDDSGGRQCLHVHVRRVRRDLGLGRRLGTGARAGRGRRSRVPYVGRLLHRHARRFRRRGTAAFCRARPGRRGRRVGGGGTRGRPDVPRHVRHQAHGTGAGDHRLAQARGRRRGHRRRRRHRSTPPTTPRSFPMWPKAPAPGAPCCRASSADLGTRSA